MKINRVISAFVAITMLLLCMGGMLQGVSKYDSMEPIRDATSQTVLLSNETITEKYKTVFCKEYAEPFLDSGNWDDMGILDLEFSVCDDAQPSIEVDAFGFQGVFLYTKTRKSELKDTEVHIYICGDDDLHSPQIRVDKLTGRIVEWKNFPYNFEGVTEAEYLEEISKIVELDIDKHKYECFTSYKICTEELTRYRTDVGFHMMEENEILEEYEFRFIQTISNEATDNVKTVIFDQERGSISLKISLTAYSDEFENLVGDIDEIEDGALDVVRGALKEEGRHGLEKIYVSHRTLFVYKGVPCIFIMFVLQYNDSGFSYTAPIPTVCFSENASFDDDLPIESDTVIPPIESDTDTDSCVDNGDSGCNSTLAGIAIIPTALAAGLVIFRKRKK